MKISLDPFLRMLHSILPEPICAFVPEPEENGSHVPAEEQNDTFSRLQLQASRVSIPPTEEFMLMSSAQRENSLNFLYELVTEALRGSSPRAEADLLHIASSRDPLSGLARQLHNNFVLLFEMFHTDDPVEFGRSVHNYLRRIYERIAYLLEEGPDSFRKVILYENEILLGPARYIQQLFDKKFAGSGEDEKRIATIRHDSIGRMHDLTIFEDQMRLKNIWTEANIEKLKSMHLLGRFSSRVHARTLKISLPDILIAMMVGINVEVDIGNYFHYRDGLDLETVDNIWSNLLHNELKYHRSEGNDRFIKISWDPEGYAFIIEDNGTGIKDAKKVKEGIEKLGWRIELRSKVDEGTKVMIYPKPGDVFDEDSQGPDGAEGGGRNISGISSDNDVSQYTRPQAPCLVPMMSVGMMYNLVPAVPVWAAGAGIAGWAPGITPPAFIGLI